MRIVNQHLNPATAPLQSPSGTGYLLLAAEIDRRPMFLRSSATMRQLIPDAKRLAAELQTHDDVVRASVFRGFANLVAAQNHRLLRRATESGGVERARYDLVILIETRDPAGARHLRLDPAYKQLAARVTAVARRTADIAAANVRNMGDVDASRPGVFLFNFFYGADPQQIVPVWEYTAGWFNVNTGLDNSRVMEPLDGEREDFGIINHCRWDRLRDIAPKMVLRTSFRRFVLANFTANHISAQPILYRLA
ncbi:hypothetical protein EF847_16835 [Actinobacteria bacterium YIM 96077]|uniref:Uncharacterized protein n=1 Tax=Phytoactinopolyspora halophila TaxID=1981511 RepID=A0A329QC10_9ACTN|nr:hypothetical protein [Phytoactinopolyspora halophila]AYY14119.1 hypothetical protein EF847_16835 [Actinobacteria bacterium YIM 96077]RAW09945.1 hypothetical protein DPM12_19880 [Phytoactinopolyspora halophila]